MLKKLNLSIYQEKWKPIWISCTLKMNICIQLIIWMLIVMQQFLVRLISYSLTSKCWGSTAAVLLVLKCIYILLKTLADNSHLSCESKLITAKQVRLESSLGIFFIIKTCKFIAMRFWFSKILYYRQARCQVIFWYQYWLYLK